MMTNHSRLRMKQRMGYRGGTAERIAQNALEKGHTTNNAPTYLERWYLHTLSSGQRTPLLYQNHYFIFAQDTCITVLDTPRFLRRRPVNRGKEHIRHPRQYYKLYGFPEEGDSAAN